MFSNVVSRNIVLGLYSMRFISRAMLILGFCEKFIVRDYWKLSGYLRTVKE